MGFNPIAMCFNPNVTGGNYNVMEKNPIAMRFCSIVTCFYTDVSGRNPDVREAALMSRYRHAFADALEAP